MAYNRHTACCEGDAVPAPTIDMIKIKLAAFEKFVRKITGK